MTEERLKIAVNKISEMLEMQKALNNAIMKEKGLEYNKSKFNENNLDSAIVDEIGELNHELKSEWCWWKDTQKPKDNAKVLEELVDVWHFVLSKFYLCDMDESFMEQSVKRAINMISNMISFVNENDITGITWKENPILAFLISRFDIVDAIVLTFRLGFAIDDVYNEYIAKNKINYERLKSGY